MDGNDDDETLPVVIKPAPPAMRAKVALAAKNPDVKLKAFDAYPWAKDINFQALLKHKLFTDPLPNAMETGLRCRIILYRKFLGVEISLHEYLSYRCAQNRTHPAVKIIPDSVVEAERLAEPDEKKRQFAQLAKGCPEASSHDEDSITSLAGKIPQWQKTTVAASIPQWQAAAPKAALYVDKSAVAGGSDKEPYPKKFEEIIEHIQTGKPIEGIRQIPDTVIENSSSTWIVHTAPPKPWEKKKKPA
ncbi:uncharacterized protein BCR38DRAFT_209145 [Pseudomassariella vexata]|uniref:Uncharacterized protein n=1 Tax=Pseudomassariella vexata TaxID=1141098 RepID=A0A1Y2DY21_9PEZI|nr:uncharacterized protein BCR38DRAFT_209145 [Pseudomassariella vexata]ORY64198.1 hypothetical protein BCR38DRAFT_209145 [Pseudomassariella vexata]